VNDLTRLPEVLEAAGVPGVAVAVVRAVAEPEVVTVGWRDPVRTLPVTPETVFAAASLTKQAVLFAALETVSAGRLDLDRPLADYVPEPFTDEMVARAITARHVLTHTTGWPNWRSDDGLLLQRPPGTTFGYSGEGFVYLQNALAALWEKPFQEVLQDLVFLPLRMTASDVVWRPLWETDVAVGTDGNDGECDLWRPETPIAASSLYTTAADYARLISAFLDPALRTRFPEVYAPQSRINGLLMWTLGWGYMEADGRRALWQWGDNPGFKAFAVVEPDADVGLVVFTNADTGQRVCRYIVLRLLDLDHPAFAWRNIRM
jgi:CubicO group peptidase (beta-lactamase class C family)